MTNRNQKSPAKDKTYVWQRKLLPFMMGSILVMGLFFFVASLVQLYYLHRKVAHTEFDILPIFESFEKNDSTKKMSSNNEYLRWKTLALLEQNIIKRRYHQANSVMLARVWTRYLGFVTGMILALVGTAFILGKLREEPIKFEADSQVFKASLYTSSPGIVLAVLGTILMVVTLTIKFEIETRDVATYTKVPVRSSQTGVVQTEPATLDVKKKEQELFGPVPGSDKPKKEATPEGKKKGN